MFYSLKKGWCMVKFHARSQPNTICSGMAV